MAKRKTKKAATEDVAATPTAPAQTESIDTAQQADAVIAPVQLFAVALPARSCASINVGIGSASVLCSGMARGHRSVLTVDPALPVCITITQ